MYAHSSSWLGNSHDDFSFGAGWHVWHGLHLLYDLSGTSHGDRKGGNVLGNDTAGADGAPISYRDAGHDRYVATDPAVVANRHGLGVFDAVAAGLDVGLVCGGEDGDIGAEQDAVSNVDHAAVKDDEAVSFQLAKRSIQAYREGGGHRETDGRT